MIRLLKYDVLLETEQFIEWIELMALQGWFIKYIDEDSFFVHFEKGEPQNLKYCIFVHRYSKFKSDEFIEAANEQGWELVRKKGYGLYLFKSKLEDPIPLETDFIEVEKKNKSMFRSYLNDLLVYGFLLAFYSFKQNSNALIIFYGSFVFYILAVFIRRRYINSQDKAKKSQVAKWLRIYKSLLAFGFVLIAAFNAYQYAESRLVDDKVQTSGLIYQQNFQLPKTDVVKFEARKSLFSFTPRATSLIQYIDEQGYSRIIYTTQKPKPWLFSENDLDRYFETSQVYFPSSFNGLKEWKNEEGVRIYSRENQSNQYLTVFVQDQSIYTLHTLNFNYEEHLELLGRMGQ